MSQESKWAIVYVRIHQQQNLMRTSRMPHETTHTMILDWWEQWRKTPTFLAARARLDNARRLKVDNFLIESTLYEYVVKESELQLVVPTSVMISKYLSAWEFRPMPSSMKRKLQSMRNSAGLSRHWCHRFRHRWNVAWGVSPPGKVATTQEMKMQVET